MQYRQGDVFVERVESMPADATPLDGPIILAHGEVTGHCHEIKTRGAKLFDKAGERFLVLAKQSVLRHQEHDPITLEPGTYRVVRQREYSPEAIRNVAD